jgi:hypothetical protein
MAMAVMRLGSSAIGSSFMEWVALFRRATSK